MFEMFESTTTSQARSSDLLLADFLSIVKYPSILGCGIITGTGVTAMHYTGVLSTVIQADAKWNVGMVILSYIIAVVASFVAMILLFFLRGAYLRPLSSVVMATAVCLMHYVGMHAVRYHYNPNKVIETFYEPREMATIALVLACCVCLLIQGVSSVHLHQRVSLYSKLIKKNDIARSLRNRILLERSIHAKRLKMFDAMQLLPLSFTKYHSLFEVGDLSSDFSFKYPANTKAETEEIQEIIDNPVCCSIFKQYCIKNSTVQHVAFLSALKVVNSYPEDSLVAQRAFVLLVEEFFQPGARFELPICAETRSKVIARAGSGKMSTSDFHAAVNEVVEYLRTCSFKSFMRTPDYALVRKLLLQFPPYTLPEFKDDLGDVIAAAGDSSLGNPLSESSSNPSDRKGTVVKVASMESVAGSATHGARSPRSKSSPGSFDAQ